MKEKNKQSLSLIILGLMFSFITVTTEATKPAAAPAAPTAAAAPKAGTAPAAAPAAATAAKPATAAAQQSQTKQFTLFGRKLEVK